jgi:hypothetical protein
VVTWLRPPFRFIISHCIICLSQFEHMIDIHISHKQIKCIIFYFYWTKSKTYMAFHCYQSDDLSFHILFEIIKQWINQRLSLINHKYFIKFIEGQWFRFSIGFIEDEWSRFSMSDQDFPWDLLKMSDQDFPWDLFKMSDQDLNMNDYDFP